MPVIAGCSDEICALGTKRPWVDLKKHYAIRVLDNCFADRLLFEVTGGFVESGIGYPHTVYDVHEIRIFEDDRYDGEGQVCYRKDAGAYEYFPMVPGLY